MARSPGKLFSYADFSDLSLSGVASALSRLASSGEIKRAHKGVYYVPRTTALGEVPIDPVAITQKIAPGKSFPTGLAASNALGLTTQLPARTTLAFAGNRPSGIHGVEFIQRSGTKRRRLQPKETALLEVLRDIRRASDLKPRATVNRLVNVLTNSSDLDRLLSAALHEPPRARAMLGALAEYAEIDSRGLLRLRKSLNPVSRYDFGPLAVLPTARDWQAKSHAS